MTEQKVESVSPAPAETITQAELESIRIDDVIISEESIDNPVVEEGVVTPEKKPVVEKPYPSQSVQEDLNIEKTRETVMEFTETATPAQTEVNRTEFCDRVNPAKRKLNLLGHNSTK